ncbi:hypothetical protein K469DRAFT_716969 [Zopfia rhizophila CBS 207.26]|uniref:Uncharacterized protein n=1 Tax=Zopfia rhizophila CBS 207.26 TaxID=1314779 RepID=A0A6A6EP02_9PEZI|nr:hypothetical protein K469DRAFT_716969 [Zopfia rhizophila CBS 207.26]
MKTFAAISALLSLVAAAPAAYQPSTTAVATYPSATPKSNSNTLQAVAIIRLDVDLASEEARQIQVTVGTQVDTNFLLEGAQIVDVDGGNVDPNDVVCQATENNSSNVAGVFTVNKAAVFNGGTPTLITSISCDVAN